MRKTIVIFAMLFLVATNAMAWMPKGFENYNTWQRMACIDMMVEDQKYHVHMYDKNRDGYPEAAELYAYPFFTNPVIFMFDINKNRSFDPEEIFSIEELKIIKKET